MSDARYWKKKLREAERELDAATKLSEVKETAAWYMRVKERVRQLEQQAAST